ncbi:MAG TPA: hypothetical protein VI685_22950 [Candidatus Angelobacter sp.]
MVRGSFAFAAVMVLMFAALTVVYLHLRLRCTDQVIYSFTSPDGRWTATVMEARCGDNAPFLTHVNLRPAGASIQLGYFSGRAEGGEVFLLEQDAQSADVNLNWTAPNHLAVSCNHCQVAFLRQRQEHWQDVAISYIFGTR